MYTGPQGRTSELTWSRLLRSQVDLWKRSPLSQGEETEADGRPCVSLWPPELSRPPWKGERNKRMCRATVRTPAIGKRTRVPRFAHSAAVTRLAHSCRPPSALCRGRQAGSSEPGGPDSRPQNLTAPEGCRQVEGQVGCSEVKAERGWADEDS